MSIKEYLQKKKDPEGYLQKRAHEILRELEDILAEIKPKSDTEIPKITELRQKAESLVSELSAIKPELLLYIREHIPAPVKGDKGDAYVLTSEDKKEIAETIKVPIVKKVIEKTEVIKQPIVKEVAVPERLEAGEIANRLNTTKETIDASVIKGLLKTIEELKRAIRAKEKGGGGGGGGMGNVQHESTNVSSATTQITTQYKIAGNGYAIMGAYYQGQLIMRGTHYTVGGDRKTLSLLFTPQDATVIDVIYVRG